MCQYIWDSVPGHVNVSIRDKCLSMLMCQYELKHMAMLMCQYELKHIAMLMCQYEISAYLC